MVTNAPYGYVTPREAEVLSMVRLTNKQIGERLHISESTVRAHIRSLMTKYNARNRTDVALIARSMPSVNVPVSGYREWEPYTGTAGTLWLCPVCFQRHENGHTPDCAMGAVMAVLAEREREEATA